jgi:hypothetical protein
MSRIVASGFAALLLAGLATPTIAQNSEVEEVVVTAERLEPYNPARTPAVTMTKRADNLITTVTVICDTRDESQRKDELRATLRNIIRAAAQNRTVELGLGDEIIGKFDETMLDSIIIPDRKADTSRAELVIKTRVTPADSFDAASGRIRSFVKTTPKVGRTEVLLNEKFQLTIIGPLQYRPAIAKLVADDAKKTATAFGEGYGVEVSGLQLPVSWYQSGPLDLALYIPYTLVVRPSR